MEIRRATLADVETVADIHWAARTDPSNDLPAFIHSRTSVSWFVEVVMFETCDVWLAEAAEETELESDAAGYLALEQPDWLAHLYLTPTATGRGIGSALVELAKRERPDGLQLWTFQSNVRARRFYARHGFIEVEWTDGVDVNGEPTNEERAPDVRMTWTSG